MNITKLLHFWLLVFIASTSLHSQSTYHIDAVNGNDTTGTGTQALPYRTFDSIWHNLQGGESIILYNGNYGRIYQNYYHSHIQPTDWIRIEAADGFSPEMDSIHYLGFDDGPDRAGTHQAYIHLKGIHIRNGIKLNGSQHMVVEDCLVERTGPCTGSNYNIAKSAIDFRAVSNLTVENSEVTNSATGISGSGVNINVLNCEIHHLTNDGIRVTGWRNSLVEGNTIYNLDDGVENGEVDWNRHCDAIHVFIGGASTLENLIANRNVTFRGNTIYNCESQGLQFNNYYAFPEVRNSKLIFENNIFGPTRANRFNCADLVDTLIFRNNTFIPVDEGHTFTSPLRTLLCDNNTFRIEPDNIGLEVYNNILPHKPNVSDTQYCDYNLYYSDIRSSIARNSIADTNVFLENLGRYDGILLASSRAINAGTRKNEPSGIFIEDFYGTVRDNRPDMGAYELPDQSPAEEADPPVFNDDKYIFVDDFEDGNLRVDPWLQAENTQGLSWENVYHPEGSYNVIKRDDFYNTCLNGPNPEGKGWIFSVQGENWADYSFEFDAYNSYVTENDGPVFLAKDTSNCYWLDISRDNGRLVRFMEVNGIPRVDTLERNDDIRLPHQGIREYKIAISHLSEGILIEVDADRDNSVDFSFTDSNAHAIETFTCGKIGFHIDHSNGYSRAYYDNVRVVADRFCEFTSSNAIDHLKGSNSKTVVYPNPSTGEIFIATGHIIQAEIISLTGEVLLSSEKPQIDISHLPGGIYIVRITGRQEIINTEKVLFIK